MILSFFHLTFTLCSCALCLVHLCSFALCRTIQPSNRLTISSNTPLNFYSHSTLPFRPIIISPFLLLLSVSHQTQLRSFPTTYLTKLTVLPHTTLPYKLSHHLTVQPSHHLFYLPSHTPLSFYSHSPRPLRPIIITLLSSQNPGFTKKYDTSDKIYERLRTKL